MYRFRRATVRSGERGTSATGVIAVSLILVMLGLRAGASVTGNDPTPYRLLGDSGPSQTPVPSQPPPTQTPVPSQPPSQGLRVDCGPEGDLNPTGTQHTVTCTVQSGDGADTPIGGADVDYQVTGANPRGPQHGCNTGANGICSFTYTGNNAGSEVIQAWANQDVNHDNNDCGAEATADAENDDFCDQVGKTWQARTAKFLDIEPETDTNPNETPHTLTATFTDQFGDPIELAEGQLMDIEIISGPNANLTPGFRDFECPSNDPTQGGTCTATYTDAAALDPNNATDTICAWISTDGDDDQYDPSGAPEDGGDCDAEKANETEQGVDPNGQSIPGNEGNDTTDSVLKTWADPDNIEAVTVVDASPETATNPNGTQHQVSVTLTGAGGPIQGISPNSIIANNAAGRPAGDVADPNVGTSPNAAASQGNYNVYSCTPSTAQGESTCTFQDPLDTPTGTDTIVFYVNQAGGGTAGPDASEPQDAVQNTWTLRREHAREVTIRFRHREGRLVISGVLSTTEDDFEPCVASQRLRLQRRADDKWVRKARPETNENGRYRVKIRDRRGRYRVIARQTEQTSSNDFTDVCLATRNQRRHRH